MKKVLVTLLIVLMTFSAIYSQGKGEATPTGKQEKSKFYQQSWLGFKEGLDHVEKR